MIAGEYELSDVGLIRDINQDALFSQFDEEYGIFVLADGMGGYDCGEYASHFVVSSLEEWWLMLLQNKKQYDIHEVSDYAIHTIEDINRKLILSMNLKQSFGGSTLVVLIVWGEQYSILHVGDSRAYRIAGGDLELLTEDDIWDNLETTRSNYTQEEILANKSSGKLTAAIGAVEKLTVHLQIRKIESSEVLLLCSDGIYKCCQHSFLKKTLTGKNIFKNSLNRKLKDIEKEVRRNGAEDNYTAILCEIKK